MQAAPPYPWKCWLSHSGDKQQQAAPGHWEGEALARPPTFPGGFRDAEEAAKGRDGYDFNGSCLRVELKRGAGPGGGRRGRVPPLALQSPAVAGSLLSCSQQGVC